MMYGDYHTHTTYSHGTGGVEDNVKAAIAAGLREIAVTDHGPRHLLAGIKLRRIPEYLGEIERMRAAYPEIAVLSGIEANFISVRGDIDLPEEYADRLDVVVCGYHKGIRPMKAGDAVYLLGNLVSKNSKRTLVRNTDAYVNALARNDIDIISHPCHDCRIDLRAVGTAAAEKGTLIELNGKRVSMSADDLVLLASLGCKFILDSDAHRPDKVGCADIQADVWKQSGLPDELIVNLAGAPHFMRGKAERARRRE